MDFERELAECHYYAVFRDGVGSVDRASMLVRKLEAYREEQYAGHGLWVETDKLYRIASGRDSNSDYRQITEAEELQLRQEIDASWAVNWHHLVVSADGVPFAVVLTARNPDRQLRPALIARDGHCGRAETDLLDRVPDESAWAVEEADPAVVPEILARIEVRRREEAGLTGGYAVFRRLADVLDLETACEVVPERSAEHEFAVALTLWETKHVTGLVRVKNAKRQAAPVGGHQYFALFTDISAAADLHNAHSVIRSTVDSWPQRWAMFLKPGQWLPALRPPEHRTLLPLGPDDLETVLDRLEAAESRYLEVYSRGRGRVALLRLTGTAEESALDLGWEPSEILTRLPGEDSWFVSEVNERTMTIKRFDAAHSGRSRTFRDDDYEYFAVFPDRPVDLDLSHAQLVIRRRDEVEEKHTGSGWVRTDEQVAVAHHGSYLPISRAEMERLIS